MMQARQRTKGSSARPPGLLTPQALAAWAAVMGVHPADVGLDDEGYPHCDGEPKGSSLQCHEIYRVYGMLKAHYARRPDVFLTGDSFVHHDEDGRLASAAPDVCVAFGAEPDPNRMSYKLWRPADPTPDFVMEIPTPRTKRMDMGGLMWHETRRFTRGTLGNPGRYARMGISEFWLYDAHGTEIPQGLAGYRLDGDAYRPLPRRPDGSWRSEALGLDLRMAGDTLKLRDIATGRDLMDLAEMNAYGKREHEAHMREHKAHMREREAHMREREAHNESKARLADAKARLAESKARLAAAKEEEARLREERARLRAEPQCLRRQTPDRC